MMAKQENISTYKKNYRIGKPTAPPVSQVVCSIPNSSAQTNDQAQTTPNSPISTRQRSNRSVLIQGANNNQTISSNLNIPSSESNNSIDMNTSQSTPIQNNIRSNEKNFFNSLFEPNINSPIVKLDELDRELEHYKIHKFAISERT